MRSSFTTVNTCSGRGRVASADSETFMAPTPSWARGSLIEVSQSPLSGAMFAGGLAGGRVPLADADVLVSPAATETHDHDDDRQQKCRDTTTGMMMHVVFPPLDSSSEGQYGEATSRIEWDFLTMCTTLVLAAGPKNACVRTVVRTLYPACCASVVQRRRGELRLR